MPAATVTVRGSAVVPGEPDEVVVGLEITALDRTPESALTDVARRSEALESVLAELGIPHAKRTTTGVSVQEEREYEGNKWFSRGYRATNRITVRLSEGSTVGSLMREATDRTRARIEGPEWRIAPDNPARIEACRQAALEARRKAEAYAVALGQRLGSIVAITEPGLRPPEPEPRRARPMALSAMASEPTIDVSAGELDVWASIDVTFALEDA